MKLKGLGASRRSFVTRAGVSLSIGEVLQKFAVYVNGLEMDVFVADFGTVDPVCGVVQQELFEVEADSRVGQQSVYQNVVVFVLTLLLHLTQVLHRHLPFLCLRQSLHVIPKGLAEIFGDVFCVSFRKALAIYGGFLKEAYFFIPESSNPGEMLLGRVILRRLLRVSTFVA